METRVIYGKKQNSSNLLVRDRSNYRFDYLLDYDTIWIKINDFKFSAGMGVRAKISDRKKRTCSIKPIRSVFSNPITFFSNRVRSDIQILGCAFAIGYFLHTVKLINQSFCLRGWVSLILTFYEAIFG